MSGAPTPSNADLVAGYLRGQNLEQVGRADEAAEHYEAAVRAGFDATGPYDRLIAFYSARAEHVEVVRVADAALANVRTHAEKRAWYQDMKAGAERALRRVPPAHEK